MTARPYTVAPGTPAVAALLVLVAVAATTGEASAQCPVGTEIVVDYDLPGSGYSEQSDNWTSWGTSPCYGTTYRYLSHTVGDGTRRGSATFQPAITRAGHWQFRTGYRASTNRTNDADYFAYDDLGGQTHTVVDQRGDGCQWVDLGVHYCQPGGSCRVVLDGTDDTQSDCADVTTFRLVDCEEPGDGGVPDSGVVGRCDGIRANAAYEVCEETATTCAGVFTDGAGCVAYCAAAAMTCVARFGGEPGCQKEPGYAIPCDDNNGHASDWCECEGAPLTPDAGTGGAAGAAGTAGATGVGGTGVAGHGGTIHVGGATSTGSSGGQGAWAVPDSPGGGSVGAAATPADEGSCGCRARPARTPWAAGVLGVITWLLLGRRRQLRSSSSPRAARPATNETASRHCPDKFTGRREERK